MGLSLIQRGLCLLLMLFIAACASLRKEKNVVVRHYYDCCDPSLQVDAKLGCKYAAKSGKNQIVDENGDLHIFIWSDCRPGEEPWRKLE